MNLSSLKKLSVYAVLAANLSSVWLGTSAVFIRDAIVFCFAFVNSKSRYHLHILSGILLILFLINSGFDIPSLSKFRNFIFFPFLIFTLVQVDKNFNKLKSLYVTYNLNKVLYFIFLFSFTEALFAGLFSDLYNIWASLVLSRLQEIGTGVGIAAGFFLDLRLITPVLNPVQFSVILFTFYIFSSGVSRAVISFIAIGLCASKSFIVAILFYGFSRAITNPVLFSLVLLLIFFVPATISFTAQETVHLASMELRVASLTNTFEYIFTHLTVPIEQSFISLPDLDARQIYGFESFIGSFIGVTGVVGLLAILGLIFFVGINKYRVTATCLILLMYSDNVSSLYLYVLPLLLINLNSVKNYR
jgi:hypothetical protein